jgi:cytochrome c peroxidase
MTVCFAELQAQSVQENNTSLRAKTELGRRLFYDADLSINGTMSCATCHEQKNAFADGNQVHPGALGDPGIRNVPSLSNVAKFQNLTWAHNGLSGLAEQSLTPIRGTKPVEMGMHGYEEEIPKRLSQNACYQKLFALSFPEQNGTISLDTLTLALESFERTLVTDDSVYDKSKKENKALPSKEAQEGEKLFFGTAQCSTCHSAPLFSDDDFHQVQPLLDTAKTASNDFGLSDVTGKDQDKNLFRTPSLRNAALTSPYWHNGSAPTLKDAILKHNLAVIKTLSSEEIDKINAFIHTLSDYSFTTNPQFSKPDKGCPY